jgi:hypothetical protein
LIPDFDENAWKGDGLFEANSLYSSGVVKLRENFRKSIVPTPEPQKENKKEKEKEATAINRFIG